MHIGKLKISESHWSQSGGYCFFLILEGFRPQEVPGAYNSSLINSDAGVAGPMRHKRVEDCF